jgi:predicted GNAT family acetyltransferase
MTAVLRDAPDRGRYEYQVGGALATVSYRRTPGVATLTHARVPDELGGQGVGSAMVRAVLEDVRARGETVVPACGFVRAYIGRHPEFQDLVARAAP